MVIGLSAGGMNALTQMLPNIKASFNPSIIIVQHLHPQQGKFHLEYFSSKCKLPVHEAMEREKVERSTIYFAPPNYHLLLNDDETFCFNVDGKINYCRPAVDALFESASDLYGSLLMGVILTGANNDGAKGLLRIKQNGGYTIVQTPEEAEAKQMPVSAIEIARPHKVMKISEITTFLNTL